MTTMVWIVKKRKEREVKNRKKNFPEHEEGKRIEYLEMRRFGFNKVRRRGRKVNYWVGRKTGLKRQKLPKWVDSAKFYNKRSLYNLLPKLGHLKRASIALGQ